VKKLIRQSIHSVEFAKFGQVLVATEGKPLVENSAITYWGGIARFTIPPNLSSGLMRSRNVTSVVEKLERHTETAEILVSLNSDAVICMATSESLVGTKKVDLGVFAIKQGEAVKMHPGTWHWLPIPVGSEEADFLVLFQNDTENSDMEVVELFEPVFIESL
jgi:ureidoglycolate hydrolase